MRGSSDTDALLEVATQAVSTREYELGVLAILRRRLGFDVAMFKRAQSCGTHGLDPNVELACQPLWDRLDGVAARHLGTARQSTACNTTT